MRGDVDVIHPEMLFAHRCSSNTHSMRRNKKEKKGKICGVRDATSQVEFFAYRILQLANLARLGLFDS